MGTVFLFLPVPTTLKSKPSLNFDLFIEPNNNSSKDFISSAVASL